MSEVCIYKFPERTGMCCCGQSYLWNTAASHRTERYGSDKAVEGDLVLRTQGAALAQIYCCAFLLAHLLCCKNCIVRYILDRATRVQRVPMPHGIIKSWGLHGRTGMLLHWPIRGCGV